MFIIDRFEGKWAVVEYNRSTFNIPKCLLPSGAKEGDVINITVLVDKDATEKAKKSINKIADSLFED
ncbi:DUF3006 domain-containing protein [Desulfofalx alkaliphila]|uniref:DUF3006 domain-containing protein n=1 Tax=Desulfofalx alkaliphila TaxID=105483 RepID=UPI0004E0BCC4|nr:DUF3006 domain-containing protein [Desulfofalx alkaliphila]